MNDLPNELNILLESNINKHKRLNIDHHYPIKFLDHNSESLKLKFGFCEKLQNSINYDGIYIPLKNMIELSVSDYLWTTYSNEQKKNISHVLLKEIGHIKVTDKKIDYNKNNIYIKIGFCEYKILCTSEVVNENKVLYHPYSIKPYSDIELAHAFEEIFNDYECHLIDSSYHTRYQYIMEKLIQLAGEKVLSFRYKKLGLDKLYKHINSILGNEKDTYDLFCLIKNLYQTSEYDYLRESEKVLKYINYYNKK